MPVERGLSIDRRIHSRSWAESPDKRSAFSAETTMPRIIAELNPWCSISFNPAIVTPSGVVTESTRDFGMLAAHQDQLGGSLGGLCRQPDGFVGVESDLDSALRGGPDGAQEESDPNRRRETSPGSSALPR